MPFCPTHEKEIEGFCATELRVLCAKCLIHHHSHLKEHKVQEIDSAVEQERTKLAAKAEMAAKIEE